MKLRSLFAVSLIAVAALIQGCASAPGPNVTTTWTDPAFNGPPFTKLFVVALTAQSLDDQRGFETFMVQTLQGYGVPAVAGWQFVPAGVTPDQAMLRAAVQRSGCDGVLLIRPSTFSEQTAWDVVPGAVIPVGPGMYAGWYEPGVASVDYSAATVYTTLFNVKTERPVWTFNPPTYNPRMLQDGGGKYADEVAKLLVTKGLVGTL